MIAHFLQFFTGFMIEPNYNQRLRKIRILPMRSPCGYVRAFRHGHTSKKTINGRSDTQTQTKRTTGEHENGNSTSTSWQLTSQRRVAAFFYQKCKRKKKKSVAVAAMATLPGSQTVA